MVMKSRTAKSLGLISVRRWRRLPPRATPFAFAFYMSTIMALVMCTVIVGTANEFDAELPIKVLIAYSRAMPIAFVSLLAVRPVVFWLVRHTVRQS